MNPLVTPPALPYQLPDFANLSLADYEAAFHQGITEQLAEIAAIVATPGPPTIENTLLPLERSGQLLRRAVGTFHVILWSDGTDEVEALYARLAPEFAAHQDAISMNRALYERLTELDTILEPDDDAARDQRKLASIGEAEEVVDERGLNHDDAAQDQPGSASCSEPAPSSSNVPSLGESRFLLKNRLKQMRRAGVALAEPEQARLRELNERITELQANFGRLLVAGNNAGAVLVSDESELAGLPADTRVTLAQAAEKNGQEGWLIELELPTHQEIIAQLENAGLRARLQAASEARGRDDGETDTRAIITEMARLRAEHAELLGYATHADYVADGNVIETAAAIEELLGQLAEPALANARREAAAFGQPGELASSDWAYLAERERREQLDFDTEELRPYFELESVLHNGVFYAANQLYGLSFVERPDLVGYLPEVRVFEVFRDEPGSLCGGNDDGGRASGNGKAGKGHEPGSGLGLVLYDFYSRPTKRGGAWMGSLVEQSRMLGNQPVVVQNLNVHRPAPGEPTLLNLTNVKTMFHEFGHALHGLLSDTYYPSQSGTNTPSDFVEYPSQVNEVWMLNPQVLANYAKHYQTGEPLPETLAAKLRGSQHFGEGFALVETLGANAIDQAWHRLRSDEAVVEPAAVAEFEARALESAGVNYPPIPPRYRSSYYNHIWASGYSAAYYSYLLSQVFDADTRAWFAEHGGLSRANGEKFRREVLARGFTRDPKASFRALRGRDAEIGPLLELRGLQ